MNFVVLVVALVAVLIVGVVLGLAWRGTLLVGDRRVLDRLSAGMEAERRMHAVTHAAMAASRRAVRDVQSDHPAGSGR